MNAVYWKSLQSCLTCALQKVCCRIMGTEHPVLQCMQSCLLYKTICWLLQWQYLQVNCVNVTCKLSITAGLMNKFDWGFSQTNPWHIEYTTNSQLHKSVQYRHALGLSFWLISLQTSSVFCALYSTAVKIPQILESFLSHRRAARWKIHILLRASDSRMRKVEDQQNINFC